MTKQIREQVYQKYNGRCAYCGHEITLKEMQVDHIIPQRLGGADSIENYNPSCRICNHYKRATRLETWRSVFLGELIKRIKKIYIVKVAERYGMITFHEWDNKFYFEKINSNLLILECSECGKYHNVKDMIFSDGKWYCLNCWGE